MSQTSRARIDDVLSIARASRAIEGSVRSWTGHSALSSATETALSRLVTSGTYQTRVSAMRAATPRVERSFLVEGPIGAGATLLQRRQGLEASPFSG